MSMDVTNTPSDLPVVDGDYSRVKVTTQIPLTQFYVYMDQFFRVITDEDMRYLQHTVTFFLI